VELAPHLELPLEVLGDRLDHQVGVRELGVVERRRDPAADSLRLGLLHPALLHRTGELLLDLRDPLVQGLLVELPHRHLPALLSADLGDAVAHEPAAHDADLADRHMCWLPLLARARGSATRLTKWRRSIRGTGPAQPPKVSRVCEPNARRENKAGRALPGH